jgi:hypothetical protein
MTVHKYKLIAPNSLPIVKMRLEDGSVAEFDYEYDDKTKASCYLLSSREKNSSLRNVGPSVLIDSNGQEWAPVEVEYYSLLHHK